MSKLDIEELKRAYELVRDRSPLSDHPTFHRDRWDIQQRLLELGTQIMIAEQLQRIADTLEWFQQNGVRTRTADF